MLQSINCIRLSYYNVKIRLVYLDKLCWLKPNFVEQVHQCKVMLGSDLGITTDFKNHVLLLLLPMTSNKVFPIYRDLKYLIYSGSGSIL